MDPEPGGYVSRTGWRKRFSSRLKSLEMNMEIRPLRTDSEIQEFIKEHYGSVENYLSRRNDPLPLSTPKPQVVHKSTAETFLELCDAKAKSLGHESRAAFHAIS